MYIYITHIQINFMQYKFLIIPHTYHNKKQLKMDQQQNQPNLTKLQLPQDLLINQIQAHQTIKKAHNNSIQCIAAHPSHKSYASGSHDKSIKLWDINKLVATATLNGHTEGVWSLDYSNDGKILVSGSPDKSVLVWPSGKNNPSMKLVGHKDKVYCAKISEDDKLIASVGEGGQLLIWDIAKGQQPIKKINLNTYVGYDISWSGNRDYLFVTSLGGITIAVDTNNFNVVDRASINVQPHSKMQGVCSNWKTLPGKIFCASQSGTIIQYTFANSKLKQQIQFLGHVGDGCRNVNLHPNQKYMLSSGKDGSVRLWDCNVEGKPQIKANLVCHTDNVTCPVFVGNQIVVTSSWDQNIGIWNFSDLIHKK